MKLTKARREMLETLKRSPGAFADYYPPLKWCMENGYAKAIIGPTSVRYEITPDGDLLLQNSTES